jgi:hypothetical protein
MEKAEIPKNFAGIIGGLAVCILGAAVVWWGVGGAEKIWQTLLLSLALLAVGIFLIYSGMSRVWAGGALANAGSFVIGVIFLIACGTQLVGHWKDALLSIVPTVIGIAIIFLGVEIANECWKRFRA